MPPARCPVCQSYTGDPGAPHEAVGHGSPHQTGEARAVRRTSTVLLVDDDPLGREALEALLFSEGYQLAFAATGPEALAKAATLKPDVILLDVMMPGMDGFEVCRRLRADVL